jgi:hypothetical protein
MKYVLATVLLLCVLGGLGYIIYTIVLVQEPSVVSSEMEGLEAIRPRNMKISENTGDSFVVEWEVASSVTGYIKYGDTSATLSLIAQDVNGTAASRRHRVRVSNLTPGKKYYFWVMSDDVAFGRDGRALEVLLIRPGGE